MNIITQASALAQYGHMASDTQALFRFPNGYGASVVRHERSYGGRDGLYELAVIQYDAEDEWAITYDTPVTADVLGWLSPQEVTAALRQIMTLGEAQP